MSAADSTDTCVNHPDRAAGVSCQRCGKLICPSCMKQASVGFHCPECVHSGQPDSSGSSRSRSLGLWTVLMAANLTLFVVGVALGDSFFTGVDDRDGLLLDAATWGPAIDVNEEWWRIFTGGFLHHGIIHLASNMFALYILGRIFEEELGSVPFLSVYFASLLAGSFGALLEEPRALIAGASGAIFGLLGAFAAMSQSRGRSVIRSPLGFILLVNLVVSLTVESVSLGGHVGGLVAGYLVGTSLALPVRQRWVAREGTAVVIMLFMAITVSVLSFFGALWAAGRWVP